MTTTNAAGSHKHGLPAATSALIDSIPTLKSDLAALAKRVATLEATPGPIPSGATVITPQDSIATLLAQGERTFVLRGGAYHESFGSAERHEAGVTIDAYPGEPVTFDGTGLPQNWLYLGPGADWTLGAIALTGFRPKDSGIIGVGDNCALRTKPGFVIVGSGPKDPTSHGIYCHGSGSASLDDPSLTNLPGSALQTYRGSPKVIVTDGRLGGLYETVLAYSGSIAFDGTAFTEPTAAWDIQNGGASVTGLSTCTGTGPGGSLRAYP